MKAKIEISKKSNGIFCIYLLPAIIFTRMLDYDPVIIIGWVKWSFVIRFKRKKHEN